MGIWRNLQDAPEGFGTIFWMGVGCLVWVCSTAAVLLILALA